MSVDPTSRLRPRHGSNIDEDDDRASPHPTKTRKSCAHHWNSPRPSLVRARCPCLSIPRSSCPNACCTDQISRQRRHTAQLANSCARRSIPDTGTRRPCCVVPWRGAAGRRATLRLGRVDRRVTPDVHKRVKPVFKYCCCDNSVRSIRFSDNCHHLKSFFTKLALTKKMTCIITKVLTLSEFKHDEQAFEVKHHETCIQNER